MCTPLLKIFQELGHYGKGRNKAGSVGGTEVSTEVITKASTKAGKPLLLLVNPRKTI